MSQDLAQQPVQPGERQIRLGFHAVRAQHQRPRRHLLYRVSQHRGLTDPRLPPHHQRAPGAAVGVRQHAVDHRALTLTAQQLYSRLLKPRAGHNAC